MATAIVGMLGYESPPGRAWEAYVSRKPTDASFFAESDALPRAEIEKDRVRIWWSSDSPRERKLALLCSAFVPGLVGIFLEVIFLAFPDPAGSSPWGVLVIGCLVSLAGVVLIQGGYLKTEVPITEIIITRDGLSRTRGSRHVERWSWDDLDSADFRKGILRFAGGDMVQLRGRITLDMWFVVRVVDPECRLRQAWEQYVATPRPGRGFIRCQPVVGGK